MVGFLIVWARSTQQIRDINATTESKATTRSGRNANIDTEENRVRPTLLMIPWAGVGLGSDLSY